MGGGIGRPGDNNQRRYNIFFDFKLTDDITANGRNIAGTFSNLRRAAKEVGVSVEWWNKKQNALNINLKQARKVFKDGAGNILAFRQAMTTAGMSTLDMDLLTRRLTQDLIKERRAALGLDGVFKRVFSSNVVRNIRTVGYALQGLHRVTNALRTAFAPLTFAMGKIHEYGGTMVRMAVESARRRETSMNALEYGFAQRNGGNKTAARAEAKDVYQWGIRAAQQTPLSTDEVMHLVKTLGAYNFSGNEIKGLASIAADVEARMGEGKSQQVIDTFGTLRRRGYAQLLDVRALTAAGLPTDEVFQILGKRLGFSGEKLEIVDKVRKYMKGGAHLDANVFMNAIVEAQSKMGGTPGTFSLSNAKTLTGVFSNLGSVWEDLFNTEDIEQWSGIKSLKRFMISLTEELVNPSKSGGGFLGHMKKAIDNILGGLDKITDVDIARWVERIGALLEWASEKFRVAWDVLDKLIHAGEDISFSDALLDSMIEVGFYIGKGIKEALWGTAGGLAGLMTTVKEGRYINKYGLDHNAVREIAQNSGMSVSQVEAGLAIRANQYRAAGGGGMSDLSPGSRMETLQTLYGMNFWNAGQGGAGVGPLMSLAGGEGGWNDGKGLLAGIEDGMQAPSVNDRAYQTGKDLVNVTTKLGEPRASVDVKVTVPVQAVPTQDAGKYGRDLSAALAPDLSRALTSALERNK